MLRAVDELHEGSRISDVTWRALAETPDREQLMEATIVVATTTCSRSP